MARAEAGVQTARAFVFDSHRARLLLTVLQAMRASVAAINAMFTLAEVYTGHPLQRCLRDIHIANQHIYFSTNA